MENQEQQDQITAIAQVAHAANAQWCSANGDDSQKPWFQTEQWQRDSAIAGVKFKVKNPDAPDSAQHDAWMKDKVDAGWVYGESKDPLAKTHPCIVPFDQLPEFQQKKDKLFQAIVAALL